MTTTSPTFHVHLFSTTIPPTNNDLEAEKRSFHRQRSTRRLEAARGTTPLLLNLDSKRIITTDSPTTPRTRAVRRKGQLFSSPTSSISSTEPDYLFINTHEQSDLELYSPSSSSCSYSPAHAGNPVANGNSKRGISARVRAGNTAKTSETEGPQRLAQPYLLQLRSLPVPLTANIKPSNTAVTEDSKSLSATSSSFNMQSSPTTPTTSSRPHQLTINEKRKKLAKLTRTLGENVPPELVFPSSATTPTTPTTSLKRTTSLLNSGSRWKAHKTSHSVLAISTSKTSTPLSAVPSRAATAPTTPELPPSSKPRIRVEHKSTSRPLSMTTPSSPTEVMPPPNRGTSLDDSTNPPFQDITVVVGPETTRDSLSFEWGRRKGKGWSGEWNVKNMEDVAKALRGLKAR